MSELVLVLDNLRSCHNVGSILRTTCGFGWTQVIFVGITPYPQLGSDARLPHAQRRQTAQIAKTALGAEQLINGQHFATAADFLQQVQPTNLICLEQTAHSVPLTDYRSLQGGHLVVGNELDGVSQPFLQAARTHLAIPMVGNKNSFNVAVATAIALYQLKFNT